MSWRIRRKLSSFVNELALRWLERSNPKVLLAQIERRLGVHVLKPHYYSPIPEEEDFPEGFWSERTSLPGIEIDSEAALRMVEEVFPAYLAEFRESFPIQEEKGAAFWLINAVYMAVDAHVYYCLIRHLKPSQILEIGSGMSTRLATAAVERNRAEGKDCRLTAVEPYPPPYLKAAAGAGEFELIEKKVQQVPISRFKALAGNDILFIDSSHVLREGNDVQREYLEILPRLQPGVYVHVHDISLPERYPRCYFDQRLYWNEQYLLQAFLAFNTRFEVVWPGNYLMVHYPDRMTAAFPEITDMRRRWPHSEPTAFWMRVRE